MRIIDLSAAREPVDLPIRSGDIAKDVLRRPALLYCRRGKILVTIEGDREDYQLDEGHSLLLPKGKLVVMEGCASFSLTALATGCWWNKMRRYAGQGLEAAPSANPSN